MMIPPHEVELDGSTSGMSDHAEDARDLKETIQKLTEVAKTSQSANQALMVEISGLKRQLRREDEASRANISSVKAELMTSYRKNISISKTKNAEIDRLRDAVLKRDVTIKKLREELAAAKNNMS